MSGADFDKYVEEYRNIINKVSNISGEQFEYFIQLRLSLMKERLAASADTIRILDFGCGIGATEIYLKNFFPDAEIYAVDSSTESIRAAQRIGLEDVTFTHSDRLPLPYPNDYFDIIYSNGTYHHITPERQQSVVNEMYRLCRTDGALIVFENNPKNPLMMRAMRNNPFDNGAIAISPSTLLTMATSAGFACKDVNYYFFFPRFLRLLRFTEKWLRKIPLGAQYFLWAVKVN